MRTPNAVAAGTPAYRYVYYTPSERDLTGTTGAAGWLKAVIDPTGRFVVFAFDRAGNVARTWDRNATLTTQTADTAIASYPASAPAGYTSTTWGSTAAPWRYVTSDCNQLDECSTYVVDRNGNQETIRPPRGTAAGDTSFDIVQTFDAGDLLRTTATPAARAAGRVVEHRYDGFGNRVATLDANGNVETWMYDTVNRPTQHRWTRGPVVTLFPGESCSTTTNSSHAPLPANRRLCQETTSYDGVDNPTASQDANSQTTTRTYDARHRVVRQDTPRNNNGLTIVRTETRYDLDGNVLSTCRAREFTEGSGSCSASSRYAEHRSYNPAGNLTSVTSYRSATSAALVTTYGYDRDGNQTALTDANGHTSTQHYDELDRLIAMTVPRDANETNTTTRWYDAAGDVVSVIQPGGVSDSTGADGDLVVDGAQHPQADPYIIPPGAQYEDVTLINGGWIAAAAYNNATGTGGVLDLHASGTVSICAGCGATMVGRGPAGGAGDSDGAGTGAPGAGYRPGSGGASTATIGSGGGAGGGVTPGGAGLNGAFGSGPGGAGGAAYGNPELSGPLLTLMGSGGGGGGGSTAQPGAPGGAGGGHVRIVAERIIVSGNIRADGTNGGSVSVGLGGGGGGGGSGGTIWLTANEVNLAVTNPLSVNGSVGGTGTNGNNGGPASGGRVRVDAGYYTGPGSTQGRGASAYRTRVGRITAYSYDDAHRLIDTVVGADSPDAAAAGVATGTANTRTRLLYDADGHVVGRYSPRAFETSTTAPDDRYLERTAYDTTGRAVTRQQPRADVAVPGTPVQPSRCAPPS